MSNRGKIMVAGVGRLIRNTLSNIYTDPELKNTTISLPDIDKEKLETRKSA